MGFFFFFFSFLELVSQDRVFGRPSQCYSDPTALPLQVSPSRYGPFAFWTEAAGDWKPERLMCPIQAVVEQEWLLRCRLLDLLLELGEELSLLYHTEFWGLRAKPKLHLGAKDNFCSRRFFGLSNHMRIKDEIGRSHELNTSGIYEKTYRRITHRSH